VILENLRSCSLSAEFTGLSAEMGLRKSGAVNRHRCRRPTLYDEQWTVKVGELISLFVSG
jgi:hypothetical protein